MHVYNRTLTRAIHKNVRGKTLYEVVADLKSDLSNLGAFCTSMKVLKPDDYRKSKVEPKVWTGVHVGYVRGNAYCTCITELSRVFVSKCVTFIEKNRIDASILFSSEDSTAHDSKGTQNSSEEAVTSDKHYLGFMVNIKMVIIIRMVHQIQVL